MNREAIVNLMFDVEDVTNRAAANRSSLAKRCLDYLVASLLLIACFPILVVVALVISFTSKGPTFFIQEREALMGKRINVIKFRSMYVDADERLERFFEKYPKRRQEWLQYYKLDKDPRLLPLIGPFLRKSSIDELPQLWNVLRGDMSLVGPRPFPYRDLETLDPEYRRIRQTVWPGLTGLWQVRRGGNDAKEKLDIWYVKNWSLWLDVKTLAETLPVVLFAKKPNY